VKNSRDLDLERKEFGFTVYINGANSRNPRPKTTHENVKSYRRPRTSKNKFTSGDQPLPPPSRTGSRNKFKNGSEEVRNLRAKTAPEKGGRKKWNVASFDLKTSGGQKIRIRTPGGPLQTGCYDDDFEGSEEEEGKEGLEEFSGEETDSDADSRSASEEIEEDLVHASKNDVTILVCKYT